MSEYFERNHAAPEVCGTCKYHAFESLSDDWICVCDESDYYSDFTGYKDTCEEWEERE